MLLWAEWKWIFNDQKPGETRHYFNHELPYTCFEVTRRPIKNPAFLWILAVKSCAQYTSHGYGKQLRDASQGRRTQFSCWWKADTYSCWHLASAHSNNFALLPKTAARVKYKESRGDAAVKSRRDKKPTRSKSWFSKEPPESQHSLTLLVMLYFSHRPHGLNSSSLRCGSCWCLHFTF